MPYNKWSPGPGCLKLMTSLVNDSLKFQTLIAQICQYFLLKKCEKLLQCKSFSHFFNKKFIPDFRRQPGNRSRLKCVYGFIMELVSFSSIILKLIMILLLCKRLLILHYLTNVHMYFLFIFVDNILVLFSHNWKYPLFL